MAPEVPEGKAGSLKWRLQKLSEQAMGPVDSSVAASEVKAGSLKWRLRLVVLIYFHNIY